MALICAHINKSIANAACEYVGKSSLCEAAHKTDSLCKLRWTVERFETPCAAVLEFERARPAFTRHILVGAPATCILEPRECASRTVPDDTPHTTVSVSMDRPIEVQSGFRLAIT